MVKSENQTNKGFVGASPNHMVSGSKTGDQLQDMKQYINSLLILIKIEKDML